MKSKKEFKIKIEKNIPIPTRRRKFTWAGILLEMEPGDSILCPDRPHYHAVWHAAKKNDIKITARTIKEKIRVWRLS